MASPRYYIKGPIEKACIPIVDDIRDCWNSECPVVQKQFGAKRVIRHIVISVTDPVETIAKHRIASDNCRRHENNGKRKQPAHRNYRAITPQHKTAKAHEKYGRSRPTIPDRSAGAIKSCDSEGRSGGADGRSQKCALHQVASCIQAPDKGIARDRPE